MQLILLTRAAGNVRRFHFGNFVIVVAVAVVLGLTAGGFYLGLNLRPAQKTDTRADLYAALWRNRIAAERTRVAATLRDAQTSVDALARRLGELQARVIRVDALGARLVDMAKLDAAEFDFGATPGRGGPIPSGEQRLQIKDFLTGLGNLARQLDDRDAKLRGVEVALMQRNLRTEMRPAGRPVVSGWISSGFGKRIDPISGKVGFHEGIDFAGSAGAKVVAVAAGVVIWSGRRKGYGNVVEIDHGQGLITRYAHNRKNLVKVGDAVGRGQTIALLGSTGYSTGPHVHFEVLENGRPVNPMRFVRAGG